MMKTNDSDKYKYFYIIYIEIYIIELKNNLIP